jgi:FtsZ-binding cell division protein ZapB
MISDFHDLYGKIGQLAELAQSLRSDCADLRARSLALEAENTELARRMQQAHERISALLEKMPSLEQHNEQDEEAV